MKAIIIINDKGKMKEGCDIYPMHSIHDALIKDGLAWTKGKRDSIHKDISYTIVEKITGKVRWCNECSNHFTKNADFEGDICRRCHSRINGIDRD